MPVTPTPRHRPANRREISNRIATTASRQLGLITTQQLIGCGLGRGGIAHRRRSGLLVGAAPRVFAVGRPAEHPFAAHLAAVLSYSGDAWLSHWSAAAVWDLRPCAPNDPVDLLVVASRPRPRMGLRLHKTLRLEPPDRARRGVLPVTSVTRTVLDLSCEVDENQLERLLADAAARYRCGPAELAAAMSRAPARSGHETIRRILDQAGGPRRTRSEAERRLLALVREAQLPVPRTNVRIGEYEVDAVWDRERVIVEVDGFAFHSSRRSFERDRRRDADLHTRGWLVFRTTWRGITEEPLATVSRLASVLAARSRAREQRLT